MARDERDYVRGPGRASQLAKRVLPEGEAEFRADFAKGRLPVQDSCVLCDAGVKQIRLRRQHVHYIKRRAVVCPERLTEAPLRDASRWLPGKSI